MYISKQMYSFKRVIFDVEDRLSMAKLGSNQYYPLCRRYTGYSLWSSLHCHFAVLRDVCISTKEKDIKVSIFNSPIAHFHLNHVLSWSQFFQSFWYSDIDSDKALVPFNKSNIKHPFDICLLMTTFLCVRVQKRYLLHKNELGKYLNWWE